MIQCPPGEEHGVTPHSEVQTAMFQDGNMPSVSEVEAFCQQARKHLAKDGSAPAII